MCAPLRTVVGALALWMVAGASEAADNSTGGYIGVDYTYGFMGDVDAKFRTSDVSHGLDDSDNTGSVSFGYDFGKFRTELKFSYAEGDVTSIDGVDARSGSKYNYGLLTIGALHDFDDVDLTGQVSLTPFIGLGVGFDGGYMSSQKSSDVNCDGGAGNSASGVGCSSGDDRSGYGFAARATLGAALNLTENFSVTTSYDFVEGNYAQSHLLNAGIRLNF